MATAALDRAMLDMDAARKAFEAAAVRVSGELEKLQQRVTETNAKLYTERESTAQAVVKRRRRSGGGAGARSAGAEPNALREGGLAGVGGLVMRAEQRAELHLREVGPAGRGWEKPPAAARNSAFFGKP